ncbi:MAG: NhaP-type Na+/H+ and K+/H+ antiporter [Cyclobacteriaceae bacterium]|jgi:NhaP-type Na+/H+ and K+/H+ antiporter
MKSLNIVMGLATLVVIATAVMKVLHLPGSATAELIGNLAFLVVFFGLAIQNSKLKRRVKELKSNQNS